jgi:hypothetical protein
VSADLCSACRDEIINSDKPHGYEVWIELKTSMVSTEVKQFHKQGSEATVRRWALMKSGFVRVVKLEPYTRKQWHNAYGHGGKM